MYRSDSKSEILTQNFLKKYINHCRTYIKPILTDNSITLLSSLWASLRQRDFHERESQHTKVLPITIRSYETLIRLSTAHAKLRLSKKVEKRDCFVALNLLKYALFNELMDPEEELNIQTKMQEEESLPIYHMKEPGSNVKGGYSLRGGVTPKKREDEPAIEVKIGSTGSGKKKKDEGKKEEGTESKQLKRKMKQIKLDEDEEVVKTLQDNILGTIVVTEAQLKSVFKSMCALFTETKSKTTTVDELWKYINEKPGALVKTKEEMLRCLVELEDKNKLMYTRNDNKIYSM